MIADLNLTRGPRNVKRRSRLRDALLQIKAAHRPTIQQDPRALRGVRRGSNLRSYAFALGKKPSYILDFDFGCRCQAVGNWVSPGGVMSVAHPPAS